MPNQPKKFGIVGLAICALIVGSVFFVIAPWAFHMDGRLTPFCWWGTGRIVTTSGTYPLYVFLYPATNKDVHGWGSLCLARNTVTPLDLHGQVRGAWWNVDHATVEIGLSQPEGVHETLLGGSHNEGSFGLFGAWHGPKLVLADYGSEPTAFPSGQKIERASVTLTRGTKSDFNVDCSKTAF